MSFKLYLQYSIISFIVLLNISAFFVSEDLLIIFSVLIFLFLVFKLLHDTLNYYIFDRYAQLYFTLLYILLASRKVMSKQVQCFILLKFKLTIYVYLLSVVHGLLIKLMCRELLIANKDSLKNNFTAILCTYFTANLVHLKDLNAVGSSYFLWKRYTGLLLVDCYFKKSNYLLW